MRNMIVWNQNINPNKNLLVKILEFINQDKFFNQSYNLYTTYYKDEGLVEIKNYYSSIIENLMKDLGLHHRSKYNWHYWIQLYNNTLNGHVSHDHFDGSVVLSWVHFIQVSGQKCFYFLNSKNDRYYPDYQSNGDFIVFPPWALHGVDKVKEKEFDRVTVAGNIILNYISCNKQNHISVKLNNSILWNHQSEN